MAHKLHSAPPFRAEHMGSLLRPQKLLDIREGQIRDQGKSAEETNLAAVALWHELGFEVVGTVPEAFDSRTHGLVGLYVMHRFL